MERQRLQTLISDPALLADRDLLGLGQLREKYPWFSSAHLLLALAELRDEQLIDNNHVGRAAVSIPERAILTATLPAKQTVEQTLAPQATEQEKPVLVVVPEEETPTDTVPESPTIASSEVVDELDELIRTEAMRSAVSIDLLEQGLKTWEPPIFKQIDPTPAEEKQEAASSPIEPEPALPPAAELTNQVRSFTDWLQGDVPITPQAMAEQTPDLKTEAKESADLLLTKAREKAQFFSPARMAKRSLEDHDGLVTDTLAQINIKQGNFKKAIEIYQRLAKKHPAKADYYATLILQTERKAEEAGTS